MIKISYANVIRWSNVSFNLKSRMQARWNDGTNPLGGTKNYFSSSKKLVMREFFLRVWHSTETPFFSLSLIWSEHQSSILNVLSPKNETNKKTKKSKSRESSFRFIKKHEKCHYASLTHLSITKTPWIIYVLRPRSTLNIDDLIR